MRNAGRPKQRLMKNHEHQAPMLPQVFINSWCWFRISPSLGSSIMLWSAAPVERYETNASAMNSATSITAIPSVKFNVSLWNILSKFSTLDRLLSLLFCDFFSFFFFAIFCLFSQF